MTEAAMVVVPEAVEGLLVYGSRARGDSVHDSDLDLLALVDQPRRTINHANVSVSFYPESQLLSGIGSLFGAHLKRDAKVLWDPSGRLSALLSELGEVDTERLLSRAHDLSVVLGAQGRDLPKYLPGLLREARYLLRSCLYAKAISEGKPCFSVREIAARYGDSRLGGLLTSRPASEASVDELRECCARLEVLVGPLPFNPHGSLEALIVNEWSMDSDVVAMALLALGGSNSELDYIEVRKVLL